MLIKAYPTLHLFCIQIAYQQQINQKMLYNNEIIEFPKVEVP